MVEKIGRKQFNTSGRGRIGRMSFGKKKFLGERQRQEEAHEDAKRWRDKAREKILHSRQRLKEMFEKNEAETEKKLKQRKKNINPLFFSLMTKFSRRGRYTITHPTIPRKPKYSLIEPAERIYGQKWSKISAPKRKLHPTMEVAVNEIKAGVKEKAESFKKSVGKPVEEKKGTE